MLVGLPRKGAASALHFTCLRATPGARCGCVRWVAATLLERAASMVARVEVVWAGLSLILCV